MYKYPVRKMCDIWKVAGSSDQRDRGFQIPLVVSYRQSKLPRPRQSKLPKARGDVVHNVADPQARSADNADSGLRRDRPKQTQQQMPHHAIQHVRLETNLIPLNQNDELVTDLATAASSSSSAEPETVQ